VVPSEVQETGPSIGPDEDMDLEFYELREEAVKRVAIKSSVKIHLVVWAVINIFLVFLNLLLTNFHVTGISDFWAFWTICGWGFGLYVHSTVWLTLNVKNLGKKMFYIHILVGGGLIVFLMAINLLTMPTYLWFGWVVGAEIALILLHYYISFISTGHRLEQAIKQEIEFLKQRITKEQ